MSYYSFNREELLRKVNEKYHNKQKASEYYKKNREAIKEKARKKYKNLTEKGKELKRQHSRDRYSKLNQQSKG